MAGAPNILLVENDEADRYAWERALTAAGFTVTAAASSMRALDLGRSTPIDVLVTDLRLEQGEPHGLALANMLRSRRPGLPVVFVTAYPELLTAERGQERILVKPFALEALLAEIHAALGAAERA